ncbi:hypothetical protein [Nonomuraea sp. NPDC050310]|uniref:hypothetical protein n=1 Tax=Nonomuraea sp. NPDC050310 TaxID=3154935 RepID=UPI0033EB3AB4
MNIPLLIVLLALVMAAATLLLFTVLVISIRREDSRRHLDPAPTRMDEQLTRLLLGTHTHHDHDTRQRR